MGWSLNDIKLLTVKEKDEIIMWINKMRRKQNTEARKVKSKAKSRRRYR